MRYCLTLFMSSGVLCASQAQDLHLHRWENRVLLLFTEDLENPEYLRQIRQLQRDPGALEERRLVVYTILEDRYAQGLPPGAWSRRVGGTSQQPGKTGFFLELIGLDGGSKLRSGKPVPASELWSLIDAMPMRRAELKNKGIP